MRRNTQNTVMSDYIFISFEYEADFSIRLLPLPYCIGMSLGSQILIFDAVG